MPDPVEQVVPDRRQPVAPSQTVNIGGEASNGFLGLTGLWKSVANFSAVVVVVGLGCGVIVWTLQNDRADQRENRQLFREAIKDMNDEQNRRTGEVKGSVDKNTDVMRELIAEFKAARQSGTIRHDAQLPKAAPP